MGKHKILSGIIIGALLVLCWTGPGFFSFLAKAFSFFVCLMLSLVVLRRVVLTTGAMILGKPGDPPALEQWPKITVFIPAHNEQAVIGGCLEAILNVDYPKEKFEIVVIDDASSDNTAQIVKGYSKVLLMQRRPDEGGRGKPAALNAALRLYQDQDICFFLDADTIIEPGVMKRAASHLAHYAVGAVAGRLEPCNPYDSPASFYTAIESWTHQLATLSPASCMGLTSAVLGSNWAIRRLTLDAYGFKQQALLEDTDISVALQTDGMRIVFDKGMVATHEAPATIGEYFRQHVGWARGFSSIGQKRSPLILTGEGNPIQKLDRLIYSWGYFDRPLLLVLLAMAFANLWRPVFVAPWWLVALVFFMPFVQMIVGMKRAKRPIEDAKWLVWVPPMFAVDIGAALTAFYLQLFARPVRWYKTARRQDSAPGSYMKNSGGDRG